MVIQISNFVRFMRLVEIPPEVGACWTWIGNKPDGRYGHFSVGGKAIKAHRWIFCHLGGVIPEGNILRHKCDNPSCVNPDHLEPGTSSQNTMDMHDRGRNADRRGTKHPLARLSETDVLEIRRLKSCGYTESALSEIFGVGRSQIGKIVHRLNWRHI